jgi:hypothetical protein
MASSTICHSADRNVSFPGQLDGKRTALFFFAFDFIQRHTASPRLKPHGSNGRSVTNDVSVHDFIVEKIRTIWVLPECWPS